MTASFTARANTTFCHAIRAVCLEMRSACGTAATSEVMNTTSAASMAASAPLPMAAPTSAPASTGASLMPSPTNMAAPLVSRMDCSRASFCWGSSPA